MNRKKQLLFGVAGLAAAFLMFTGFVILVRSIMLLGQVDVSALTQVEVNRLLVVNLMGTLTMFAAAMAYFGVSTIDASISFLSHTEGDT